MTNIIVAFPKPDTGQKIKKILIRNGYNVTHVVTNGAQVLSSAIEVEYGVVIMPYKLPDMIYLDVKENLPPGFQLVVLARRGDWAENGSPDVVSLSPPIQIQQLVDTVEMVTMYVDRVRKKKKRSRPQRSEEMENVIRQAKGLLMERNNMTENEAHRYLQKNSMDMGRSLYETAQMILTMTLS